MYEHPEADSHLSDELLNEYLDGELLSEQAIVVEVHLDDCNQCRARLDTLRNIFTTLAALPDLPLERDLAAEVIQAIHLQDEMPLAWSTFRLAFSIQTLATVALLVVAWPFAARWAAETWRAALGSGIPEIVASYFRIIMASMAEGWVSAWQQVWLPIQEVLARAAVFWDRYAGPPAGLHMPMFGIVILLVAAVALWLAGNGLLLRPGRSRGYPSISNGGNYE